MGDFIISDSGVKVWKTPASHPLLKHTDITHPAFQDKLSDPRICSINSEDARTWHYFSQLLSDCQRKTQVLTCLLAEAFQETLSGQAIDTIPFAGIKFWQGVSPPHSRRKKEGPSWPDVLITLGNHAVVFVEAKYRSDVSEGTKYDSSRDQVIRLIDVGSWYARQNGYASSYVIVLQYGDAQTNAEEIAKRYVGNPEAIQRALPYRNDLTERDYLQLSRSVAFVRWPDPMEGLV